MRKNERSKGKSWARSSSSYGARYSDIRDPEYKVDVKSKNDYKPRGEPEMSKQTSILVDKTMKGLRESTIMIAGTPYDDPLSVDNPYPFMAANNRLTGVDYKGVPNILGNVMSEINDPSNAMNLRRFDAAYAQILINYRYVNRPDAVSQFMNSEYGKTMSQLLSQIDSELVRDLSFLQDTWESNLLNLDDDKYMAALIYYQSFWMNVLSVIQAFNTCLAMQPELMKMEYLRGAPFVKALYSQLNKTTFVENVNGIAVSLPGEFLDLNWLKTINAIVANPSRKANDKFNPMITINATHWMPTLKETNPSGVVVFNSADLTKEISTAAYGSVTYDIQTLARDIINMFSPTQILSWARQVSNGMIDTTAKQYVNDLDTLVTGMTELVTTFTQSAGPIRTFLERIRATAPKNLSWTTGTGFAAGKVQNFEVRNNVLTNAIVSGILCGPAEMHWDNDVKAWVFTTMWDKYYGVPEFDIMSGGAFISCSIRDEPALESGETGLESKYALPYLFTHYAKVRLVNMGGTLLELTREQMAAADVDTNNKFARLKLVAGDGVKLNVPYFDWADNSLDPLTVSWLSYAMVNLFGMSHQHRDDTIWIGDNTVDDYDCENSLVGEIDVQRVSLANVLRTYARSQGPILMQVVPAEFGGIGFQMK